MTDLELATTDELVAELRKRNTATLIVLTDDRSTDQCGHCVYYSGSPSHALGLAEYARCYMWKTIWPTGHLD